jgi:hypothetical protein
MNGKGTVAADYYIVGIRIFKIELNNSDNMINLIFLGELLVHEALYMQCHVIDNLD